MSSWFGDEGDATVPANRWDLLPAPTAPPRVSVVVPWFRQQAQLERLLAGIAVQEGPVEIAELVVADDGSPEPPVVPSSYTGPPVVVVRQDDRGVRPGAARNLGVEAASADVLVFLDADMVPSPGYVAAVAALPAVAPEALVVGTRHHWDLDGWSADAVQRWLAGGPAPTRLEDPGWLADGYHWTRDLVDLDLRSYQLVIGAVMTMHRAFFDELGGFDAGIDAYGAEDWDLAHRAVQAGGLLAHVDAVAHHDGPDWRGRVGPDGVKNPERLHLVARIPSRTDRVIGAPPFVRVTLDGSDGEDDARDRTIACVASMLEAGGLSTTIGVVGVPGPCPPVLSADPRIVWGAPPTADPRSVLEVHLHTPVQLTPDALDRICAALAPGGPGRLVVGDDEGDVLVAREVRARRRVERWADRSWAPTWEQLFGPPIRWTLADLGVRRIDHTPDLAEVFPR